MIVRWFKIFSVTGSFQHRNRILGGHINAAQFRVVFKQGAALAVSLGFHPMVFDRLQKSKLGIKRPQRFSKAAAFSGMLGDRSVKQSDRNIALLSPTNLPHEVGCDRAAGQSIDGDNSQAPAIGRVGNRADNGDAGSRGSPDPRPKGLGVTRKGNDPIHFIADRRFQKPLPASPQDGGKCENRARCFPAAPTRLLPECPPVLHPRKR